MEKDKSLLNNAMFYGLIFGIVMVAYSALSNYLMVKMENDFMIKMSSYISYVLYIGGIVLSTLHFRKNKLDNYMTYGHSFKFGFLLVFFSSFLVALYTFVHATWINPDYVQELADFTQKITTEKLIEQGKSDEEIEMGLQMMEKFSAKSASGVALMSIFGGALSGAIFSLITSIFTQRKNKDPFSEVDSDEAES